MLEAKKLSKSFGTHRVLDDVGVYIRPGTITTLIGPSGSGKTTLLRALAMTDMPDRGEITLDDKTYTFPLPAEEKIQPWPRVTAVFQQLFLWPHLTLRENILLPARNHPRGTMKAELDEIIAALNLSTFIDRYPNEASIGQRQRIALARAVMLNPGYILMDEVTSALDIEQVGNVLNFLPRLKERGIGIMLITHALNFARRASDSILFMDQGKIIERGPAALLDTATSHRLRQFLSQVEAAH